MLQGEEILSQRSQESEDDDGEAEQRSLLPQDQSEDEVCVFKAFCNLLQAQKLDLRKGLYLQKKIQAYTHKLAGFSIPLQGFCDPWATNDVCEIGVVHQRSVAAA